MKKLHRIEEIKMDCERVRSLMAEYIGQELDSNTKDEADSHIDECDSCFNEIKKLDKVIWTLECDSRAVKTSLVFLDDMEEKVLSDIKPHFKVRIPKKVLKSMAAVAIFAVLIFAFILFVPLNIRYKVYAAATFGKVYSTDEGTFGRMVSVSSTSNNLKITVTKVAADDMGTVIYFKVEGQNGEYYVDQNGIFIKEELKLQNDEKSMLVVRSVPDNGGFILQLRPVEDGTRVLHLSFSRLYHLDSMDNNENSINGNWSFAIPMEKAKSLSYQLNKSIKLDSHDILFKSLTVGSTGIYLEYEYHDDDAQKSFGGFYNFEIVCGKKLCQPLMERNLKQNSNIIEFESTYPDYPDKVAINIKSYYEIINYSHPIKIPVSLSGPFPMKFKYNGNILTIANFKNEGGNIQLDMVEPDGQRNYDYLNIDFEDAAGNSLMGGTVSQKYYAVDENGKEYNYDDVINNYAKYRDKHLHIYPVDTVYSFKMQNTDSGYFNIAIKSAVGLTRANSTIILR